MEPQKAKFDYPFELDDLVKWDKTAGFFEGSGRVKGFASAELAALGRSVIIEVNTEFSQSLIELGYPFTHIALFERHITKVTK